MINIAYLTFLVFCISYSSGEVVEQGEVFKVPQLKEVLKEDEVSSTKETLKEDKPPGPEDLPKQDEVPNDKEIVSPDSEDGASRVLTEIGYLRYGDPFYIYSSSNTDSSLALIKSPTDTNKLEDSVDDKRPLFYFTTYETPLTLYEEINDNSGPYVEIRKKRDLKEDLVRDIPESSKIGKLRKKRTYCNRCGGGGYGYIPVTIAVYPVYSYPVYYGGGGGRKGRGKGCYRCGGGGGGGGGGFSGSYSFSSSSSHSSSGSWNYGK